MAGVYIHIPFCKQACHYCDFHFSTSLEYQTDMVDALQKEIVMRKNEMDEPIENIFLGGGTPSVLKPDEIHAVIDQVFQHFKVVKQPEITLEANPEDLTLQKLEALSTTHINRLNIGVQSFIDRDLKLLNRLHTSKEALAALKNAGQYFDNISADLLYGIPGLSDEEWKANIDQMLEFEIPHISAYALTIEPDTALSQFIKEGTVSDVSDEQARRQFELLTHKLRAEGYDHYEFSNHGKPGYFSRNNIGYWTGKPYIGIGPAAHSFLGNIRSWNIKNNVEYIKAIQSYKRPFQSEKLRKVDQYNEYIMLLLRTKWGVNMYEVERKFGKNYSEFLNKQLTPLTDEQLIRVDNNKIHVTENGKFLTDGVASKLFMLDLNEELS